MSNVYETPVKGPPAKDIVAAVKIALDDETPVVSNVTAMSTGEGSSNVQQQQSNPVTPEPRGYYGIVDDIELVSVGGTKFGVITIDCVDVKYFWATLKDHAQFYEPLNYLSLTEIQKLDRHKLLNGLLDPKYRCFVLRFLPEGDFNDERALYQPGIWMRVQVEKKGEPSEELLNTTVSTAPQSAVDLMTADLFDDVAALANYSLSKRRITEIETRFLEEIYSLNHVPDADLDEGGFTPVPTPVAPIILSNGGFSFESDDIGFWNEPQPDETKFDEIADDKFVALNDNAGYAVCLTNGKRYQVVPGQDPDDYCIELIEPGEGGHRFELFLSRDGAVKAECVVPSDETELELVDDVPSVVTYKGTKFTPVDTDKPLAERTNRSPKKVVRTSQTPNISYANKENVEFDLQNLPAISSPKGKKQLNRNGNYSSPTRKAAVRLRFGFR